MAASDDTSRSAAPARQEKRDTERIQIMGELHGEVMVFQPMIVREISRGGAQIDTRFPLQLDSLHDLRLEVGDRSIVIKARVAHCRISDVDEGRVTYRSGVEFIEPSEQVAEAVAGLIDRLKIPRPVTQF